MSAPVSLTVREAREQILAILSQIPTQNLPKFKDKNGCIWFMNLSMGFVSASDPAKLADSHLSTVFAAESAGREMVRRAQVSA